MSLVYFKITGVEAKGVDATNDFTTDGYKFENSHDWSVSLKSIGVVGGPASYTLQVSNNGSTWYDYNSDSSNVVLEDSVDSDHMAFRFLRVVYTANGTSAGTLDVELGINNNLTGR